MLQTQPFDRVSKSAIEKFQKRHGKKAARILSILGEKLQPFYRAIQSDIGQELLKDAIFKMNEILEKIIDETADSKDLAEFRVLRHITLEWSKKIQN